VGSGKPHAVQGKAEAPLRKRRLAPQQQVLYLGSGALGQVVNRDSPGHRVEHYDGGYPRTA
jgi:hypothetical protein